MAEFKRKRGYVTIAQDSESGNYVRMAYALALSIKATQSKVNHLTMFITPGTVVLDCYRHAFDEIIELPWHDYAEGKPWKIHNKWKVFHITPYEESVLLDADMLFTTDISDWWDVLSLKDVCVATQPVTYRGTTIEPGYYRQQFIENELPMVYTAFLYFKQRQVAVDYFEMVRKVYFNWKKLYEVFHYRHVPDAVLGASLDYEWKHLFPNFPKAVSGDLAFAVAMKLMGKEHEFTTSHGFPIFTHMKTRDQGFKGCVDGDWDRVLPSTLSKDLTLTVGNYVQRFPFHYHAKRFLTNEIIGKLEDAARD